MPGLDRDVLEMTLDAIGEFAAHELPEKLLVDLDDRDRPRDGGVQRLQTLHELDRRRHLVSQQVEHLGDDVGPSGTGHP